MSSHRVIALLMLLAGCRSSGPPEDHFPFLISSTPPEGSIITRGAGGEPEVAAELGDEDTEERLFIRFLIDYPASGAGAEHLILPVELPPSGMVARLPVLLRPSCGSLHLNPGVHRLTMAVSDRPFLDPLMGADVDPEAPLDSVPPDAHRLRTVWLLNCP
jgi:hypothetical protein